MKPSAHRKVPAWVGDRAVVVARFSDLDLTGCDWHPDLADHRALADLLELTIGAMDVTEGLWN